jgi:hypothetical protein
MLDPIACEARSERSTKQKIIGQLTYYFKYPACISGTKTEEIVCSKRHHVGVYDVDIPVESNRRGGDRQTRVMS